MAEEIGIHRIERRELELSKLMVESLEGNDQVLLYGPVHKDEYRGGVVTFNIQDWHCHDVSCALDDKWGILTRAGHHCCMPLIKWLGIWEGYGGNDRASFGYFNLEEEVEKVVDALNLLSGHPSSTGECRK